MIQEFSCMLQDSNAKIREKDHMIEDMIKTRSVLEDKVQDAEKRVKYYQSQIALKEDRKLDELQNISTSLTDELKHQKE